MRCKETAPAVVHVDGSARVQTIAKDGDPGLRALLSHFHEQTGIPMLINTSLNGRDLPICDTIVDTQKWLCSVRYTGLEKRLSFVLNGHRKDLNEILES
jgi:carbamoyltransferase